ncbi:MAG: aspartate aminotransferase family protein, partial [Pseudomonadota bacterium]
REGGVGQRGMEVHKTCFWEHNLVLRNAMDTLQFSPFLNAKKDDIFKGFEKVRRVLDAID